MPAIKIPTDFLGNELRVGQEVAHAVKNYRSLSRATIISITEQTVLLEGPHIYKTFRQFHEQVIVLHMGFEDIFKRD